VASFQLHWLGSVVDCWISRGHNSHPFLSLDLNGNASSIFSFKYDILCRVSVHGHYEIKMFHLPSNVLRGFCLVFASTTLEYWTFLNILR
jgi:hypothetical protein